MIRQLALCNQNQGQNYCEKETTEEAIQGIVLNTLGQAETLAETIESDPLCITDLFQNKSVAFFCL